MAARPSLLVIGGTRFLGRHVVEAALARSLDVTILNRGKTDPALAAAWQDAGVTVVHGDRTRPEDLAQLDGRAYDLVVDTCGYYPRDVAPTCAAFAKSARYLFVSSISVYPDIAAKATSEGDPVSQLPEGASLTEMGANYGPLKALCEAVVQEAFGKRALIVRPGLIGGPYDPTDRYTYWVRRATRGGAMLAPGDGARLVQVIGGRELAEFMLLAGFAGEGGIFNATGEPTTFRDVVHTAIDAVDRARVVARAAEPEWVDEAFLEAQNVQPWSELPLWIPRSDQRVPIAKAVAAGLCPTPIALLARATLAWDLGRGDVDLKAGLSAEKERLVLAAHRARAARGHADA